MVEVKLSLANDDIPVVRRWIKEQLPKLPLAASQPTRKTGDATLVYTVLTRIDAQLRAHVDHLHKIGGGV